MRYLLDKLLTFYKSHYLLYNEIYKPILKNRFSI